MKLSHHRAISARRLAGAVILALACLCGAGARAGSDLKWEPLAPEATAAMNQDARTLYEKGINQLDHINYDAGYDYLNQAVEKAPDNVQLRFLTVLVARYLGDSEKGSDSIKYYDAAAANLRAMAASNKLSSREQARAGKSLDDVNALRASVAERDAKRFEYGRAQDKAFAAEAFKSPEELAKKKKEDAQKQAASQGKLVLPTPDSIAGAKGVPTRPADFIGNPPSDMLKAPAGSLNAPSTAGGGGSAAMPGTNLTGGASLGATPPGGATALSPVVPTGPASSTPAAPGGSPAGTLNLKPMTAPLAGALPPGGGATPAASGGDASTAVKPPAAPPASTTSAAPKPGVPEIKFESAPTTASATKR